MKGELTEARKPKLSSVQEWRMLIIRYEGRDVTPAEIARKYGISRDDASALFAELEKSLKILSIRPKQGVKNGTL